MTKQEAFDRVWRHFVIEGNPQSMGADGVTCRYRGENGARCAVGLFIPDSEYSESLEGCSLDLIEPLPPSLEALGMRDLLRAMQWAHDGSGPIALALRKVARDFDLAIPSGS